MERGNGGPAHEVRRRSQNVSMAAQSRQPSKMIQNLNPSKRRRYLGFGSALIFACVLLVLVARLGWMPGSNASIFHEINANIRPRLDQLLHPLEHTNRAPKTIQLDWRVTVGYRAPDGVKKRVYLINDEFPGPVLEARSGDTIKVNVHNEMSEGVAIHWHGLQMRNSIEMDGAVGFTQCPIAPGASFTYEYQIGDHQHGTFWYHAHDHVQRGDGLYGGLIVHDASDYSLSYDEERLLLIGDWYHRPATDVLEYYLRSGSFGNEPVPDSIVVNHAGHYNCSQAVPARPIECKQIANDNVASLYVDVSKTYRFRVVNTGTLAGINLTLPGASVLPLEVDGGHQINGNTVNSIGILYPGERLDFTTSWDRVVKNEPPTLEITLDSETFRYPNPALTTTHSFPVHVEGSLRSNSRPARSEIEHFDLSRATSMEPMPETDLTPTKLVLYTTTLKLARLHNIPHGFINHTSWKPQSSPALPLIALQRSQWDENQLVPLINSTPEAPQWVDVVINNLDDGGHPFHLHGYDFYNLATHKGDSYWGSYNPFEDEKPPGGPFNLVNPVKRDTVFVPSRGYAVIRFLADNPGIWMFHCHIMWHQASGMAMAFQVGGDSAAFIDGVDISRADRVRNVCHI